MLFAIILFIVFLIIVIAFILFMAQAEELTTWIQHLGERKE